MTLKKFTALGLCATLLSGCLSPSPQGGLASTLGVTPAASLASPALKSDVSRSCSALQSDLNTLYAKYKVIEAEERRKQRKANITSGLIDTGIGIAGIGALGKAGSISGIRNTATATNIIRTTAAGAQQSGQNLESLNTASAVAGRTAELERAKIKKGC